MHKRLLKLFLFFIPFALNIAYGYDEVQFQEESKYPPQLRWDNFVGKKPYWVSETKYDQDGYITLKAGQEVIVRLDRNSTLRMHSKEPLDANMFNVKVSKGTGLYQTRSLQTTPDGYDLLLTEENYASVVRLSLKETAINSTKVTFFKSRYEPIPKLTFYRNNVDLKTNSVRLFKSNSTLPKSVEFQKFSKLEPGKGGDFTITGPARFEIITHYVYDIKDSGKDFAYTAQIELDGKFLADANFVARPDYHNFYLRNSIISLSDSAYLDIGAGKHNLKIKANLPLLVAVHMLEGFSKIQQIEASGLNIEDEALKLSQDNSTKSSGIKAATLANNMWEQRKDDISLRNSNDKIREVFTYFRELLPADTKFEKKLYMDLALDYSIADVPEEGRPFIVSDWQTSCLVKRLIYTQFVETGSDHGQKLSYIIPELTSDSELKIIVQKTGFVEPQNFYLQYDDKEPTLFTIYPGRDLDEYSYAPNAGLIGLDILERHATSPISRMGTLSGLFALENTPARLYAAGVITTPLPKNTRQIKIWAANYTNPLKVALQYLVSTKFRMPLSVVASELDLIADYARPAEVFINAIKFFDHSHKNHSTPTGEGFYNYLLEQEIINESAEKNKSALQELHNHWLDSLRFLYERYQKFASNVQDVDNVFKKPAVGGKLQAAATKQAEMLMAQGQWSEAAVQWAQVLEGANLESWRIAHIARAESLKRAGESFLAERSLKALLVNASDVEIKKAAYNKLLSYYLERQYYYGIEGLITAYLINTSADEEKISTLADILLKSNNEEKALEFASIVKNYKPTEAVVFAALKTQQGRNGNRIGEAFESKEEKHFWQAQVLQQKGLDKEALKEFKSAGTRGQEWAQHLSKALVLQNQLADKNMGAKEAAIVKWQEWFYAHPGPKMWQEADYLVEKFYEGATIYSGTRDSYASGFIVRDGNPVHMKVVGPAKIQLKIRPLSTTDKDLLKIKSWVIVNQDQTPHFIKIENHRSEGALKIIGHDNYHVGLEQKDEFDVAAGEHEIIIRTQNQAVLLIPYIERPLVALTALPPVTPETVDYVRNKLGKNPINKSKLELNNYSLIEHIPSRGGYKQRTSSHTIASDLLPVEYTRTPLASTTTYKAPISTDNPDKGIKELNKILFEYEKTQNKALLVKAGVICSKQNSDYDISQLCNSFELLSRWSRILSVDENPQVIFFENKEEWQPDSVGLSLRKSIITGESKDEMVLSDNSVLVMNFVNSEATTVKIQGQLLKLIAKNPGVATLGYQIDDKEIVKLPIISAGMSAVSEFVIDKGKHSLRLALVDPDQETFVKLILEEKKAAENKWVQILAPRKKEYFVATTNKPIKFTITAPAWIQIHRLSPSGVQTEEDYFVESGTKEFTLKATKNDPESFYRIFEKIPANPKIANLQAEAPVDYKILKDSSIDVSAIAEPSMLQLKDDLPLYEQENGTWTIGTRAVQTLASDTINGGTGLGGSSTSTTVQKGIIKFAEESATFRYFDDINRMYFHTDFLLREFADASPSYGARGRIDYVPLTMPVTFFVDGNMFTQHFNRKSNHALFVQFGVSNILHLSRELYHVAEVAMFGRHTHFHSGPTLANKYPDPDVYTYYNKIHNRAVDASYTLNFEPIIGSRLMAGASYRSNPQIKKPDFVNFKIGAAQLIEPIVISLEYNRKKYFKGRSRLYSFDRNHIGGSINWEHWLAKNNHRIELKLSVGRIFDTNIPTNAITIGRTTIQPKATKAWIGSFGILWHLGNGRDYRDFRSEEIPFEQYRRKAMPSKNEMRE